MSSVEYLVKQGNSARAASAGARVGYTRVSTVAQTLEQQDAALAAAGVSKTFSDTMSGAKDDRPGLAALMEYVRDGDTVVVWKLDRLGRNTLHILETVKALTDAGVTLISTTDGIDSSTAAGRMVIGVLASMAEFERNWSRNALPSSGRSPVPTAPNSGDAQGRRPGPRRDRKTDEGRRAHRTRCRQVPRRQPSDPVPISRRRSRVAPGGGSTPRRGSTSHPPRG